MVTNYKGKFMSELQRAHQERSKKINKIEKIKNLSAPMAVYERLESICEKGYDAITAEERGVFLKYFGIFDKGGDSFMLRIRIPGGRLLSEQAAMIGRLSKEYGSDYIDITTRQQIELRYLKTNDLCRILCSLDEVGVTTFQTGIDNFRNIVTSSLDGLSEGSLIETFPLIQELQSIFLKKEEWIGSLPRKFNTAILGATHNDCNIYGHDCCFILAQKGEKLGFNLYLGGKVGVQAQCADIFVEPDQVQEIFLSVIKLFKTYGFRDNRNKNRLHFLLEAVGMRTFREAIVAESGLSLECAGASLVEGAISVNNQAETALQDGKKAILLTIPSGIFSGSDLIDAAQAVQEANGEIRLSVEQSLYLIVDQHFAITAMPIYQKYHPYHSIFFQHQIACAGTQTCSFGVIPNKPDAIALAEYLTQEVPIQNGKIRMYWSACPKGCGIHGIADIGFEGCKAKDHEGNSVHGVHIYLGGKATREAKEARILYKSLPLSQAKRRVKGLVELYSKERMEHETFEEFDSRFLYDKSIEEIHELIQ
jgi:ferredoxin-nitrite reductase